MEEIKQKRIYSNVKEHHKLYHIWKGMHQRCYNKSNKRYDRYGKRGIVVCDQWNNKNRYGSMNFIIWAYNNGYTESLTIDRINNDGNYEPNNCRWSNIIEQANNRSNNHYIEYNGIKRTLKQWSEELNIPYSCLRTRIRKNIPLEKAFSQKSLRTNNKKKKEAL